MTAKEFIRKYYDEKHPILIKLRTDMGVGMDEVEKILEEYAQQQLAPSWVKASELPEVLPPVVVTMFKTGKVFAYNTKNSEKGLREVLKHHPDNLCLCVYKPDEQPAQRAAQCEADHLSINELLAEFNRRGFNTENWDGDEGAEKAIVDGVCNYLEERQEKLFDTITDQHIEINKLRAAQTDVATDDDWISVFQEPENLASIEVLDKYGKIFDGGYYSDNGKVCIDLPNKNVSCMDLEENFTHWRPLPKPPKQ